MGFTPKLSFTFLILLQVFIIAQGQVPLQVEFDRGTPLARDPIPASSLSSDKPQNGLLNDDSLAWRLPRNFVPTEYDVELTPIITDDAPALGAQWDVPGKVTIHFKPLTNTTRILLHSKDITINSSQLLDPETGEDIFIYSSTQPHETLSLGLSRSLEINKEYLLKFEFVSKVKEGLDGLYRSSYFDPISNSTKWIASTQMEALHARQLFPCFDEPSYKAIFHFTIGRKNEHVALANAQSTRNMSMVGVPGWTWESFAATPVMSPYLIAIIISEFKFVDVRNLPGGGVFGKQVRTYAPEHYINRDGGIYATEKADLLLRFFEDYYVEKYPLDKMDSAAVPAFFFGAMENYGLNIYRESALLYFPDESTEAERYRITNILSHELAHQWFGNLVTTAWWTHIWLNEGFATYLAAQGVASAGVGEDFEAWDRFINDAVQNSMGFDARPDYSHTVKIDEEDWITRGAMDWFDRMAYEKGGSLIRMMNGFLTEPVLKAGLLAYLNAMQFQAATQDDLFFHLNTQAKAQSKIPDDLTMKQIMDTWTLQPGFPLIRVSVAGPQSVYVSQERFINNEASRQLKQDLTGLWYVPLTVSSGAAPQPASEWLYNDIAMRTLRTDTSQWVIVNNGANGYFRTLYDAPLTKLLKEQLEADHTFINAVTRSQLLDDYFTAAWQKYTPIENALGLASYLGNETNIVVWNSVLNNLRTPFNLLSNSGSFYTSLRDFLHPRIKSAMEKTGGIQQSLPEMKGGMPVLRHLQFLDWLCAFEDADCVNYALSLVNDWKAQPATNTIRRDIKPVVYCSAVAHGTDEHFNFIKEQYAVPGITAKQQGSLLDALVCTKETSRIKEVLEGILQDTYYVSDDNRRTILQTIARNPNARSQLVQFLRGNFQAIVDRLNGTSSIVSSITALSGFASTQSELEDIQLLLSENPSIEQGSPAAIATAVNAIKSNIAWVAEYAANLRTYSQTA